MRSVLASFIVALGWLSLALPALATNNWFLPGDAFFSVALSKKDMQQWLAPEAQAKTSHTFQYERLDGGYYLCGHSGYRQLQVEGITPAMRLALAEAYASFAAYQAPLYMESVKKDGQVELAQVNRVVALFYNKSFDRKHSLGLKFNEDWAQQGGGHYAGLFKTQAPVVEDWQESVLVAPLQVREFSRSQSPAPQEASAYQEQRASDHPLHIHCDDLQIILVGFTGLVTEPDSGYRCSELLDIYDRKEDASYMLVSPSELRKFTCKVEGKWQTKWVEKKLPLPLPVEDSHIPAVLGVQPPAPPPAKAP